MSNGLTTGGTPAELYNQRRRKLREVESAFDDLGAVVRHDLEVNERATIFGSVRLDHAETFHDFNDVLDDWGLTMYALLSQDKRLSGGECKPTIVALVKQV